MIVNSDERLVIIFQWKQLTASLTMSMTFFFGFAVGDQTKQLIKGHGKYSKCHKFWSSNYQKNIAAKVKQLFQGWTKHLLEMCTLSKAAIPFGKAKKHPSKLNLLPVTNSWKNKQLTNLVVGSWRWSGRACKHNLYLLVGDIVSSSSV